MRQGRVDLGALVARIRAEFPDLAFARATLNDLGEDHVVVVLDDAWVFRFPRSAEARRRAPMERRLLERLNAVSPLATPRYDYVSAAADFGGYRLIAGRELTGDLFASLPRPAQERLLDEIGAFLTIMHSLAPELVAGADEAPVADAAASVRNFTARRPRLAEVLAPPLLAAADRFYEALPGAVNNAPLAVIHGDLTEDHVLLARSGNCLAGVIDFTDAGLGDPAYDFAFLWGYGEKAPADAARRYGAGAHTDDLLARARWWFTRYRIDQIWWSVSGARAYDIPRITRELPALFAKLGQ